MFSIVWKTFCSSQLEKVSARSFILVRTSYEMNLPGERWMRLEETGRIVRDKRSGVAATVLLVLFYGPAWRFKCPGFPSVREFDRQVYPT